MAVKIYMTNCKGGVGVTSCCVGLGIALAKLGERTLVLDGDRLCASALYTGGLANMQVYTLADFEKGACRAKQTLVSHPKISNLSFSASTGVKDARCAEKAIGELDGLFDYILCDKTGAGKCDRAIIVTEPFAPSVKGADVSKAMLNDGGIKDVGLIVNRLNGGLILDGEVMTAQEISALLRTPLKGVIPEDLSIPLGKWRKSTQKAFDLTACTVTGRRESVWNVCKGYAGLGGYIKRRVREKI